LTPPIENDEDDEEAVIDAALVEALTERLAVEEEYVDNMREELTSFLMECTRHQLNRFSEHNVSLLLRIVADLEDMSDDCYSIGLLLLRSATKNQIFKKVEREALVPFMSLIEDFLRFVRGHLGRKLSPAEASYARSIEDEIDKGRNSLKKLSRKRIEAGKNVKTELAFIDLVRRLEHIGDYCNGIALALGGMA
jgi:phosphate:Na+ symporter